MSGLDNFLSRWSRLKRAAGSKDEPQTPAVEGAAEEAGAPAPASAHTQPVRGQAQDSSKQSAAQAEAEFDLASLPSIESIGADTDVRAFLKPGVPSALRHAALRRAWSMDPAIRDFRGPQENDWDFNDPDAVPGFGKLDPDFDIRKMASSVFGDEPAGAEQQPATDAQPVHASKQSDRDNDDEAAGESPADMTSEVSPPDTKHELVQRDENIAPQHDESNRSSTKKKARRHGGALPL